MGNINILNNPVVTTAQLSAMYVSDPKLKTTIEFFEGHGIRFPIKYEDKSLFPLTILGSYLYFSGTLSIQTVKDTDKTQTAGIINQDTPMLDALIPLLEKELGLDIVRKEKGNSIRQQLSTNGSQYVRLLSKMGFYTSSGSNGGARVTKASADTSLPPYLCTLIEGYEHFNAPSMNLAEKLLRDVCAVLVDTKGERKGVNRYRVHLLSQNSEENFKRQAGLIVRAFNIAYGLEMITDDSIIVHNSQPRLTGSKLFGGYLSFQGRHLEDLTNAKNSPIQKMYFSAPDTTYRFMVAHRKRSKE